MKKLVPIIFLLLSFGRISAQQIEGQVLHAATEVPLENVNVINPLSGVVAVSGEDGSFELVVEGFPLELEFSAIGFRNKSVTITSSEENLVVYLFPEIEALSEVVLRSTIIPNELQQTPAAVSILDETDLERFDETSLVQAINTVPGVYVHQGALNTNKMSIRGIGARAQYSTTRVKAYFEGIPISSAEGATTLDDIDAGIIGRAEIIKGPTSSVYGAGLGGVINLYAAKPEEMGTQAGTKLTLGSFDLRKMSVRAAHASETTNLVAAYNELSTDSFRENADFDRESFTLHGRLWGDSINSLSVLTRFTRLKAYIPSSISKEQLEEDPSVAAYAWKASRGYESYDKGLFGLSYKHHFSETFFNTTSIYMNFKDAYEPRHFDILKEEQIATGARTRFNFDAEFFNFDSRFSVGAEYYREWYDTATFDNLYEDFPDQGSVLGNSLSNNSQDRYYYNLFAQWNLSLSDKFTLETGVNLNSTSYELIDLFHRDDVDQTGDYRFKTILSPRIGAIYNLTEAKTFYASVSHGFSTPTVAETLTPEGLINTSLEPETGINYELGFKGNWLDKRLYTEVALFSIQIENLLVAERVGQDQYVGINAGATNHNGMEFLLNYNFNINRDFRAKAYTNASLNFFSFDEFTNDGTNYAGNDLPAVPQQSITAGLDLFHDSGFAFYGVFQHEGKMPLNDANTLYNEAYNLLHLKASYGFTFLKHFEMQLFGGINNALDEAYAASIIPNAVGFGGAAPRYFYPGNPRNYFGGVGINYEF